LICAIPHDNLLASYLRYVIETITFKVPAAGIPQLTVPMLEKIKIPVPSLEEQTRIVSILDRFDALCNDLTSGLPAEIEARSKQYEYYRDKLLSFKEIRNA
jgi:type I restriction enzyme S subunit